MEVLKLPSNLPFVDIVIIGSGASGGACAWQLCENGASVVMLEQGDWFDHDDYPGDSLNWEIELKNSFDFNPNVRKLVSDYQILDEESDIQPLLFNAVGGTTQHWTAHTPRFHPSDFKVKSLDGVGDDWPISYWDLEKYYDPGEFNDGRQKIAKMPTTANLILNPTSGAPGFYVENVFCLPGVPSILKSMIGGLNNVLVGGDPILSKTINLRTYESEIAKSLTEVQNSNNDVEIGSYPFFRAGKLGVSIVLRSLDKKKIDKCNEQILEFINKKNIEIVEVD